MRTVLYYMRTPPLPLIVKALRDLRVHDYPVETINTRLDGNGPYPLDVRVISFPYHLDPEGIVVIEGPDGRGYHNPVSASLYALGQHTNAYHTAVNTDMNYAGFLIHARHLRLSQDSNGGWQYPISVARYGVAPGWYSAMAQGLAISVMLRAYDLTGEQSYFDAAGLASNLLLSPLSEGGCSDYDESGQPFLEECPSDPPSHILNGALFALIGLRELEARTGGDIHKAAATRLSTQLTEFDLGYWSRYDLRFVAPATQAYHSLHISLLQVAGDLLSDPFFKSTAIRWSSYLSRPGCRLRAAANKAWFVLGLGRA
jgi:heparosan-N-sulfate-glucuronate 5-epimerase